MHSEAMLKLFKKFKKEDLIDALKCRGILDARFNDAKKGSKLSVARKLMKACNGKLTPHNLALLDMTYLQKNSSTKSWDVLRLTGYDVANCKESADPSVFEHKLKTQLGLFFNMSLCVELWKGAVWVRLAIHDKKKPLSPESSTSVVYMVHFPHSPYIITTNIRAGHKAFLFQGLANALRGETIQRVGLSGKDIWSLSDMVLYQRSQGSFSQYRLNRVDVNPLVTCRKRKQTKVKDTSDPEICSENQAEDVKRKRQIDVAFGSNAQPALQKVEFKMLTRFRGTQYVAFHKKPFRCSVKFEGPSVIDGIKSLTAAGVTSVPLPSYLSNLHSLSQNHFLLKDRKGSQHKEVLDL
ncbi:predicted protein [Nematostella vectensis]|uniref:Centromere protein N n=1 Tax=Nematostella vectensis TaxID=45351 RepID=A7RPW6_NEMVE|nr:centromere protein N [Nematostella vectensis]EDO46393.1 predicted protein [Nematostella vectensis]|eukprot:XP_001638456.1 predicted protein [Nematostella vectensis]